MDMPVRGRNICGSSGGRRRRNRELARFGVLKKKSDFGLEGGGAFALVSRRAERGEKFATPPGAVVAGFSTRNAPTNPAEWARADRLDRHDDGKFVRMNRLYNLDAVVYESIMPGFFQIMYGEQNDVYADGGKPK